jgi:YihY family inner membrane protein
MERFRQADGYSYARAVGFQIVLASLPALIFFVAVGVSLGSGTVQTAIESVVTSLAPGSTSDFFRQAVEQGEQNARGNTLAIVLGGITALTSGAVGMSQVQQGAGRLYGRDDDRGLLERLSLGLALSLSVGLLLAGGLMSIAFGSDIADAVPGESLWAWLRWPLGAAGLVAGISARYQVAPNRDQPGVSWLIVGGLTATVLLMVFSGGLALYLGVSSTFGDTYGPLAGLIGFMIWAQLAGLATLAGLAFAAQLEAERVKQSVDTVDPTRGRSLSTTADG